MSKLKIDSTRFGINRWMPRYAFRKLNLAAAMVVALLLTVGSLDEPTAEIVRAQAQGICDRTDQVEEAILARVRSENGDDSISCEEVTTAQLNALTGSSGRLIVSLTGITSLKAVDFADLTSIRNLYLHFNQIKVLPSGIFSDMAALEWLRLENNEIDTIELGAFQGLTSLERLHLYNNKLTTVPSGVFDDLSTVTELKLNGNQIETVMPGAFDGLIMMRTLDLFDNQLETLPTDIFDLTERLEGLHLNSNKLKSLAPDIFRELGNLVTVDLNDNELTELPLDVFKGDYDGTLSGLVGIQRIYLENNRLRSLPDGIFDGVVALHTLQLNGNELSELPADLFPVHRLCDIAILNIGDNKITSRASKEIDGVTYGLFDALPSCASPVLTNLDVNGIPLIDSDLEIIGDNYQSLESLDVADSGLSAAAVLAFLQSLIDSARTVRILDISGIDLSSWTASEVRTLIAGIRSHSSYSSGMLLSNTGIDAETVLLILEVQDDGKLTLDFSDNDLSGLNNAGARTRLAAGLMRLTRLENLLFKNTQIDHETALFILQNLSTPLTYEEVPRARIVTVSLAGNDLRAWNDPGVAADLAAAFETLHPLLWRAVDLSDTGIGNVAADTILPSLARRHRILPLPEEIKLNLSGNQLTKFDPAWLEGWVDLFELDLSDNKITEVMPEWFAPVAEYLVILKLDGNPVDPIPEEGKFYDELPALMLLALPKVEEPTDEAEVLSEEDRIKKSVTRVLRIEPTVRGITVSAGDQVRLEILVYGRQDLLDNELAGLVDFDWDDDSAGGKFAGAGRDVSYTAPERPGTYTVSVEIDRLQCFGDEDQCRAEFAITVRRPAAPTESAEAPINPSGAIPEILTDASGTAYEVVTPVEGGQYNGEGYRLQVPSGAVMNGEYLGVSIQEGEAASNAGQTHHRYTLAGYWYAISAVDTSAEAVSSYLLNKPAEVCVPLPDELRSNISVLALVAINADDSLTILSTTVRISTAGTTVCGGLSSVPATVAAGRTGAPAPLPTEVLEMEDASDLPDTGGAAPHSSVALIWTLLIGLAIVVSGYAVLRVRRRNAIRIR